MASSGSPGMMTNAKSPRDHVLVEDVHDERPAVSLREAERHRTPDQNPREAVDGAPQRAEEVACDKGDDLPGDGRDHDLGRLDENEHERRKDPELRDPDPELRGVEDERRVLSHREVQPGEREDNEESEENSAPPVGP